MVHVGNMMLSLWVILAVLGLAGPGTVWGSETVVVVDLAAPVSPGIQLTISPQTINFPNADPDTTPSIGAVENPVQVEADANAGKTKTVLLTVQAQGDLVSGGDAIPISNVRWTATGTGYVAGIMSNTTAVTAGTWVGPGTHRGTFSFFLTNSWQYNRGNYQASVIYTLSVP